MIKNLKDAFAGRLSLAQTFWVYYQIPLLVASVVSMYLVLRYTRNESTVFLILAFLGYAAAAFFAYVVGVGVFRSVHVREGRDIWGKLAVVSVILNMAFLPLVITGVVMGVSDVRKMQAERREAQQESKERLESDEYLLDDNSVSSQILYDGDSVVYVRKIDPKFTREIDFEAVKESKRASICRSFSDDFSSGAMNSVGFRYEFTADVVEFYFGAEDCQ